jgi:hypothetical protein
MRDFVAIIIALILIVAALALATSLQWYQRGHQRLRRKLRERGQMILAEVPATDGLEFFSEDIDAFYWKGQIVPKRNIRSVQILISGAPLSIVRSQKFSDLGPSHQKITEMKPESVERERWDVSIDTSDFPTLVECGSIRQHVSQELATQIFEAVKQAIEVCDRSDHHSRS